MLIRKMPVYDFSRLNLQPIKDAKFLDGAFYILLPELRDFSEEKVLLSIPGALEIQVVNRSYTDETADISSMRGEGCFYFNEVKEWILDVAFTMHNKLTGVVETYPLRLPMSAPFAKGGRIGLYFDGVWLRFVKDGEVLNENKGFDFFQAAGELYLDESLEGTLTADAQNVTLSYKDVEEVGNADFYMPGGFNDFAGDVMNFYHDGTYHLLYLLDRRHHMSWNGKGAHYIAQLTSTDLINWQEQEPVVPITKSFESCGTGTMVYHNGKYYMSYGLHTERYIRKDPFDIELMQTANVNEDKSAYTERTYAEILANNKAPLGSTYSVSEDGVHFTCAETIYHTGRNPSIYTNEKGGLTLWLGLGVYPGDDGVWEAEGFGKPFVKSTENFDYLKNPLIPHTTECPSLFSWNGHQYLLAGFCGYYRTKEAGSNEMFDAIAAGESVYDGLAVPMVCDFKGGRKLIAGWLRSIGWGSVIVHRELIQEENGKLGLKWVPEMIPETLEKDLLAGIDLNQAGVALDKEKSYLITMTIDPKEAKRAAVIFENENGKTTELQLDFTKKRVQVADAAKEGIADSLPALFEMADLLADRNPGEVWRLPNNPMTGINFCLPDIPGMEETFELRILLRNSRKMDSTVIDAEIAGRRTILSGQTRLYPNKMYVRKEGEFSIIKAEMRELKNYVK